MEVKLFIGSSSESKPLATNLINKIKRLTSSYEIKLIPVGWWEIFDTSYTIFNRTFLDIFLTKILEEYDFGLFIISKDDLLIKRGMIKSTARDNVWFESGIFIGKKGLNNTFFFLNLDDYSTLTKPSDFDGLTLDGVRWDSDIVNLYFGDNVLFKNNADSRVTRQVKNKIHLELRKFSHKLIQNIQDKVLEPTDVEDALILKNSEKCFDIGKKLIKNAKTRLYTTISFDRSLTPSPSDLEMEMLNLLKIKIEEREASFKRYMKKSNTKIYDQYLELESHINSLGLADDYLFDFNFNALEMIISDNNVLFVFPDFRGSDPTLHEIVAFGVLVRNNSQYADVVSAWLQEKLKSY